MAGRALDNIFDPGPPPSASLVHPTKHNWSCGGGYLDNACCNCLVESYQSNVVRTEYCDDVLSGWAKKKFEFLEHEKKLKAERRHVATEDAIRFARTVLSEEQWDLLGIKVAPYRDIDRIII